MQCPEHLCHIKFWPHNQLILILLFQEGESKKLYWNMWYGPDIIRGPSENGHDFYVVEVQRVWWCLVVALALSFVALVAFVVARAVVQ